MSVIKFGTSGWRAILADEFTFPNVKVAVQAIADHLRAEKQASKGVIIGYDPRYLGDEFAILACEVLAANRIRTFLCSRDTPTPVLAFEQRRLSLGGAINFTASHNPPEYGGLKFNPWWGGPASKADTKAIEKYAAKRMRAGGPDKIKTLPIQIAKKKGLVKIIDPSAAYFKCIEKLIDVKAIRRAKLKVVVDPLYGAGRGYTETALKAYGAKVFTQHTERDVLFGGGAPEPSEHYVGELIARVKKESADLGLGTDGDADRFGVVDSDGTFIMPNLVLALLVDHLATTRKWEGPVIRSVASSHLIDAVAAKHGLELIETPVGFKHIGQIMRQRDILIGGEESGGLTVHRHVKEKDGVLACLLMAELKAVRKESFGKMLKKLYKEVGEYRVGRDNFRLSDQAKTALVKRLESHPPKMLAGKKVMSINTLDGFKFLLQGKAWVMVRFSGTEPVVRLYGEAIGSAALKRVMSEGKKMIGGN